MENTREINVVCKLFTNAVANPFSTNSSLKCPIVNVAGMTEMWPVISLVGRIAIATSQ